MTTQLFLPILIFTFAVTLTAGAASASPAELCRAAFVGANESYIDLSPEAHPQAFIQTARQVRAEVIQNLGFLPEIKRTKLSDVSDIKLFFPGAEKIRKNAIAYSSYQNLNGTTLEVKMTWVREDLRQMGLSKLLFSEILAQHPEMNRIHVSDLVDTNLEIFEQARETLGKKKSIRETPLYRKYSLFGFTEIKKVKIIKMKTHPLSLGGKDFEIVLRHPAIEFDLIRPR
jgi:hypothetical protein